MRKTIEQSKKDFDKWYQRRYNPARCAESAMTRFDRAEAEKVWLAARSA